MANPQQGVRVGFLHPGEMGAALARVAQKNGAQTFWVSEGRSAASRDRAAAAGLVDAGTLSRLCSLSDIIIGICPPHGAQRLATEVAGAGYAGTYVDANAIAPSTAGEVACSIETAGGRYLDGSIVGPPPRGASVTTLYVSGNGAEIISPLLSGHGLQVRILGESPNQASALKMCHSAMHKGQLALLFATLAAGEALGVARELEQLFASRPDTAVYLQGADGNVRRANKGWRFAGEMTEVARTFADAGLPNGFHTAAGHLFGRLPPPDSDDTINSLEDLVALILEASPDQPRARIRDGQRGG